MPQLPEIITVFERRHPGCQVIERDVAFWTGLTEVDAFIAWLPLGNLGLTTGPVLTPQSRMLGVCAGYPLAERERLHQVKRSGETQTITPSSQNISISPD